MAEPVRLKNKEKFQKTLENYQISDHAKEVLEKAKFVVLCGVAGGGRNTIINYLVKNAPYHFVVSDTTRPPKHRDGQMEVHGVNYFFRTEEEFLADLAEGEFIEAEIIHGQQVSGTSIRELQKAHDLGLIGIHDFEFGGAENIYKASKSAYIVALLPPTFEEWQKRLSSREEMHGEEFINRMKTAERVLASYLSKPYFKFIISDELEKSSKNLRNLVEKDIYTNQQHQAGLQIAQELLSKTRQLLAK